ncbi:MAG TPA: PGPGW domain-containing protein [Usitatibacter sp.]|nr:PGPGW domain-containing protein [Usitatibacter sp.]
MFSRLRREWRYFIDCDAGTRFERLHERKRRDGRGFARRAFWWAAGVLLILLGFVMLFTPGPGLLGIAFGIACLAQQSLPLARKCDRWEVRLRRSWSRWRSRRSKN